MVARVATLEGFLESLEGFLGVSCKGSWKEKGFSTGCLEGASRRYAEGRAPFFSESLGRFLLGLV